LDGPVTSIEPCGSIHQGIAPTSPHLLRHPGSEFHVLDLVGGIATDDLDKARCQVRPLSEPASPREEPWKRGDAYHQSGDAVLDARRAS